MEVYPLAKKCRLSILLRAGVMLMHVKSKKNKKKEIRKKGTKKNSSELSISKLLLYTVYCTLYILSTYVLFSEKAYEVKIIHCGLQLITPLTDRVHITIRITTAI